MAHNINTYIGRQSAWHNLGIVTGRFMTSAELLAHEGFQYSVFKSQLHDGLGRPVEAWGTFRWNHKDRLAGLKDKTIFLSPVGKDYTVIQHHHGFKTVDMLMSSVDGAHYETAGVLGNGETVWALADRGHTLQVGDDVQHGYLLFATSHDGSMSHVYRMCMERVVCRNTLDIAMSEKTRASLIVRHTKNAMDRLTDAHATLERMQDDVSKVEDKLNFLAGRKMNREGFMSIFDRLFPKRKNADTGEDVETTRRNNIGAEILKLYELNDGNAFPEQRGTAYNMLNAITNWVDHERQGSKSASERAENAIFGSGNALKNKAFELVYETAQGMDAKPRTYASVQVPDLASIGLNVPELATK
jgi:phage/plasmid-like protein (TIGR03299 family)